jgi:hypothetical protein
VILHRAMFELFSGILRALLSTLATRGSREAEIPILRQQLLVLSGKSPARVRLRKVTGSSWYGCNVCSRRC